MLQVHRRLLGLTLLALLATAGCGTGHDTPTPAPGVEGSVTTDPGLREVPGEATLAAGVSLVPDPEMAGPPAHAVAQAGVDFASNRFIAVFEDSPVPAALAPYLTGPEGSGVDAVLPTDNAPLVDHPYFRKVSVNLAQAYGLGLGSRVFYQDVNYAVYELTEVTSVDDLDTMMLRVLNENAGLVREVCYDYYLSADAVDFEPATPELVDRLLEGNPAGFKTGAETAAEATRTVSDATEPDDPMYVNIQGSDSGTWGLWRMGTVHSLDGAEPNAAWDYTTGSSDVLVAVVDTGVRYTHEDLVTNCINPTTDPPYNAEGILTDVINKDNEPLDGHGHGTFCAGQIGAEANNGVGLAGVCWDVTLLPIKVLADSGSGSDSQVAEGMLLADYLGAEIISMSLGGPFPDRVTQLAARQCYADGVLLVVAAGNDNSSAPHYPGTYRECLCVGATTLVNGDNDQDFSTSGGVLPIDTRYNARASYSNYGEWVDIAAPGSNTASCYKNSDSSYQTGWNGTSMATPYVAGCAALLWSYMSAPTHDSVRAILQSSATEMTHLCNQSNPKGFIDNTTNGMVRFCDALAAIELYDGGPYTAPTVTWDNPTDGATVTGTEELRVGVSGGTGNILRVEYETEVRMLGATDTLDSGYYRVSWDTTFEFNRDLPVTAIVYDDQGHIVRSTVTVTPDNTRVSLPFSEAGDGLADNAIPTGWYEFDGNQGSTNTSWGADPSQYNTAAPSLHTSGTTANYASSSNDWLYAPIIDLDGYAAATLSYARRCQRNSGDECYLLATADDRTYQVVSFNSTTALQDWDTKTLDLASFAGSEVRLFWVLQANGSGNTLGLWVDDISISVATGTAPTITIDSPANGASASGLVAISLTLSDDTEAVALQAVPPVISSLLYTTLPDNDPGPTKTATLYWDSRHTYNGGALLVATAYDDEDGDGEYDDFQATDTVSLSVNNTTCDANWFEGFESITTLGGTSGSSFDGLWYTWSSGTSRWRISSDKAHSGTACGKMGPADTSNYGAYQFDQLYSPVHDLSTAARPYLRLWHQLDVESGGDDYGKVLLVRYDGLDDIETPLSEFRSDTSPADTWVRLLYDLSPYQADPLRFNFLFISDNADGGAGWFIDDYEVLDADPVITSISDNARGQAGMTRTVNGQRFGAVQDTSTVTFAATGGGRTTATVTSWSDTAVQVTVPADAASGDVIVTVLGFDSAGEYFGVYLDSPVIDDLDQL